MAHKEWKGRVVEVATPPGVVRFRIEEAPGRWFIVPVGARGITLALRHLDSRIIFQETGVEAFGNVMVDNVRDIRTGEITDIYEE